MCTAHFEVFSSVLTSTDVHCTRIVNGLARRQEGDVVGAGCANKKGGMVSFGGGFYGMLRAATQ